MKKLKVIREGNLSSTSPAQVRGAKYWSSLKQRRETPAERAERHATWREFAEGMPASYEVKPEAEEPAARREGKGGGVSRRRFFGIVGTGAAIATAGCRKPTEYILPFAERPEDMIPGKPMFYATAYQWGGTVEGLIVESQDGRPTKIEGNPKHPVTQGATSVFAQATVYDLYNPDRSRYPVTGEGQKAELRGEAGALQAVSGIVETAAGNGGEGLALVLPYVVSPTERSLLADLRKRLPNARIFLDDPLVPVNAISAAEAIGGKGARVRYRLTDTQVIFSADSNFFVDEYESPRLSREWASTRLVREPTDAMSRLYVVEPSLSNVGTMADHRRRVRASEVGEAMLALAAELRNADKGGALRAPAGLDLAGLPDGNVAEPVREMLRALAADLLAANGQSCIVVGRRQPAWVHGLGLALNEALGNTGKSVVWSSDADAVEYESLADLVTALQGRAIASVIALGTNPALHAPKDSGIEALLQEAALYHFGLFRDETGILADWHIPMSHYLEAWSDLAAGDGTVTICQPLIDPLFGTDGQTEILALLASGQSVDGYSLVKGHWMQRMQGRFNDKLWEEWLHDGVVTDRLQPATPSLGGWSAVKAEIDGRKPAVERWEIDFQIDPKVLDGRLGNNPWLVELPYTVSKVAWDNPVQISVASARELGVENGDMVRVTVGANQLELPVFVTPGQADNTLSIFLGWGRNVVPAHKQGERRVEVNGVGFNAYTVRPLDVWFTEGSVERTGGSYELADVQPYDLLKPLTGTASVDELFDFPERPIVLESTFEDWKAHPDFVESANLIPAERLAHLWEPPPLTSPQQWGMAIDLNTCMGCNACVIACQSENNIPVVGKEQCSYGREMHWIRIDRYYRGTEDDPTAVFQPMLCQQCEAAPCETVCPVAATAHSPDGLNDMAYNRCIGTRYCSNNCPYKVRRFNFFNYNLDVRPTAFWNEDEDSAWLLQMQKNPDVTIRFRGVMEKCTYCVQRIRQAQIAVHIRGEELVPDGVIETACQQVCPTRAIVFGDVADSTTAVSVAKKSSRNYSVLRDLNTQPRTTYLSRVRNVSEQLPRPIPDITAAEVQAAQAHGQTHEGNEAHGSEHANPPHGEHHE